MELLPYIVKDLMFQWSARCGDWQKNMALATIGDNMASQSWDAKCIQRAFDWTCFWIVSSHTMDHCYVLHFLSSSVLAGWNHTGFSSRHLRLQPLGLIRKLHRNHNLFRLPLSGFEPAQNQHALQAAALDRCFFSALYQDVTEKQINPLNALTGVAPSRSSRHCRSTHTFQNLAHGLTVIAFTMSLMWDVAGAVSMQGFDPKEASVAHCVQWHSMAFILWAGRRACWPQNVSYVNLVSILRVIPKTWRTTWLCPVSAFLDPKFGL